MLNRYKVLVIIFVLLIIGPTALWFFLQPVDYNETMDLIENRMLAQKPTFTAHSISDFPAQYDSYYSDHLPFRSDMIEMFAALEYKLFGKSINSNVIVGKEDWLFYSNPADGSPIDTYKGTDHFTQEQLEQIANNLIAARDQIESKGIEFVVMFPPNKESIYTEHMPSHVKRVSEINRCDLLVTYLRENTNLRVVYPQDALMTEKERRPVYYHQDTHWNHLGGYIGSAALLEELGLNPKQLDELTITDNDVLSGDLRNMGRLDLVMGKDVDYRINGFSDYTADIVEQDLDNFIRLKSNNFNGKKLMMLRDSFGTAMMEYMPSYFEDSVLVHWRAFESDMIDAEQPDVFVLELVERSIIRLLYFEL